MRISDWSSDVCSSDLIVRIAKANGWTSIRINGGDTFKKAAFLAAAAQGLTVENYTPSKVVQAEADRLQARLAERDKRRDAKNTAGKSPRPTEGTITLKALSERFLSQTHDQTATDPEFRRPQSLVPQVRKRKRKNPNPQYESPMRTPS